MKCRSLVLAVLTAAALCTVSFAQTAPDTVKKGEPAKPAKAGKMHHAGMKGETLLQRINSAPTLKTFAELLKTSGLDKSLEGTGDYTIFAPTDVAFSKVPTETLNSLKQDNARLTEVLKNHIVAGQNITTGHLAKMNGQKLKTESGMELPVAQMNGKWHVGNAMLTGVNMRTANGPIHEIDSVILSGTAAAPATYGTEKPSTGTAPVKAEKK